MNAKIRTFCILEMRNYADADAWLSDMALSSMWQDAEDAEIPAERIEELLDLWQCCHDAKHLRLKTGMTQDAFFRRYGISRRALQYWECGRQLPPDYASRALACLVLSDLDGK